MKASALFAKYTGTGRPKIPKDDVEAALKMYDSKNFTLAEIEMRTGVRRPTLYLYLNRRKNGEL